MNEVESKQAAVHIYCLEISSPVNMAPYCTILEVHSPQYLSLEWLYGEGDENSSENRKLDI